MELEELERLQKQIENKANKLAARQERGDYEREEEVDVVTVLLDCSRKLQDIIYQWRSDFVPEGERPDTERPRLTVVK